MTNPRSRRRFVGKVAGALAASTVGVSRASVSIPESRWPPRLIFNDDGNCDPEKPTTPESFLAKRTTGLASSEVDVIAYSTGVFHKYRHRSERTDSFDYVGPVDESPHVRNFQWLLDLQAQGTDPLQLVGEFANREGKQIWWSMRMNDTHDSRAHLDRPHLRNDWKDQNRHLLMRPAPERLKHGWFLARSWNWSAVDYNHVEVRDLVVSIIDDVLTNYEVDGVELDFTRHSIFFREQTEGVPITDQQRDSMTKMVERIRVLLRKHERRRNDGRELRLAVHVPDSLEYCHALGLDLETWLERKLPDLVVAGSDFQLQPWGHVVEACHRHDIPVSASFSALSITFDPEVWRAEALQAWDAGVDGIATFNFFAADHSLLRQLHDPKRLRQLPRKEEYELSPLNQKMIGSLATLLKDGQQYLHKDIRKKWINPPTGL